MALVWTDKNREPDYPEPPMSMEIMRREVPVDAYVQVLTAKGHLVCGSMGTERGKDWPTLTWVLDPGWEWVD